MRRLYIALAMLLFAGIMYAQESTMAVGFVQTTLQRNAVNFAVDYAKKLQPRLELFKTGSNSLYSFTPDIKVLVGSNDVFNGITVKYVGNIMVFNKTSVAGVENVPDLGKLFHVFPISIGTETNQQFSYINGIIEAGYVPWYQNIATSSPILRILKQTKLGVFLQGGYKFSTNDSTLVKGGGVDESKEIPKENILRTKLVLGFSPVFNLDKDFGFSLIGNSTTWYDFLHNQVYYKLEGKLRLILYKDYFLDFGYEKGSGAPNFNQGEQFTTNLAVRF